jgi:hypothetical protein
MISDTPLLLIFSAFSMKLGMCFWLPHEKTGKLITKHKEMIPGKKQGTKEH